MAGSRIISSSVQLILLPAMILYFHRISISSLVLNIFVGALMVVLTIAAAGCCSAINRKHFDGWAIRDPRGKNQLADCSSG